MQFCGESNYLCTKFIAIVNELIIIIIIIMKTVSRGPSGKNKIVYKLLSQPHKNLRHGKLKKT